jgi:hypothetical protein
MIVTVHRYPTFPVKNARQLQHANVVIPSFGSVDVTSSFQFIGQVIDSDGFPLSGTTSSIGLVYAGASTVCQSGQKLDPSGFCVDIGCNDDLQCPAESIRIPDRACYNTFDDCQCVSGFFKSNKKCVQQKACPNG